ERNHGRPLVSGGSAPSAIKAPAHGAGNGANGAELRKSSGPADRRMRQLVTAKCTARRLRDTDARVAVG
ncbi:MAG: hypothetical protein EBT47_12245, partial [Chloroflexi bacterium]|nr:hypothetical protein [Chloroflexota bacterium]